MISDDISAKQTLELYVVQCPEDNRTVIDSEKQKLA
jgi:hypothetical protein